MEQVADLVCENMVNNGSLSSDTREKVRDALLRRHRHQHEQAKKNNMTKLPLIRSLADIGKNHSATKSESIDTEIYLENLFSQNSHITKDMILI